MRDRVPRVEAAHAVGDDVDPFGPEVSDLSCQLSGSLDDSGGRRDPDDVDRVAELLEPSSDPSEVVATRSPQTDGVEAHVAVRENDGVARTRRSLEEQRRPGRRE